MAASRATPQASWHRPSTPVWPRVSRHEAWHARERSRGSRPGRRGLPCWAPAGARLAGRSAVRQPSRPCGASWTPSAGACSVTSTPARATCAGRCRRCCGAGRSRTSLGPARGPVRTETSRACPGGGSGRGGAPRAPLALGGGTSPVESQPGITGGALGTSRVPMGPNRTCAWSAPPGCRGVGPPTSRARPSRLLRRGNRPVQPGWADGWHTSCRADGLCFVGGRSKTAAGRSVSSASRRCLAGIASLWSGAHTAARTMPNTASGSIQTAMPRCTAKDGLW
jgi:hypothetical protein